MNCFQALFRLLQGGVVAIDHVLAMEDVLRHDALHDAEALHHLIGDRVLSAHLPGDLVALHLLLRALLLLLEERKTWRHASTSDYTVVYKLYCK